MVNKTQLYDFLYADHERVASLVAQMSEHGLLKGYERQSDKENSNKNDGEAKLGKIGFGREQSTSWHRGIRETYDPLWKTSVAFVENLLTRQNILTPKSLDNGSLTIIKGKLYSLDLTFVKNLMNAESMVEFIARGDENENSDLKKFQKTINKKSEEYKNAQVIVEYMKTIPFDIQFILIDAENGFWFNIKREYLNLHQSDIPLKFPFCISGDWFVAGIIDAQPNDHIDDLLKENNALFSHYPSMVQPFIQLIGMSAVMFGRNFNSYGMNPLAIYRNVKI